MPTINKNQADMLLEAMDPKRVTLWCPQHSYFGAVKGRPEFKPHMGCKDCWRVFYIHELTECAPEKRAEKLAEIEEVMHKVVELVEAGKWDVDIFPHAKIEMGSE